MKKKVIKLTESQLKTIIENTILKEREGFINYTLMDENDQVIEYLESDNMDDAKKESFDLLSDRMGYTIMDSRMERQTGPPTTTIRRDVNLPTDYNLD
ncbi:hypothetical protein COB55_04415 [Candidatus Wolfebacteria bacterium]|nr:MAG: hypothetical protein COB55_04415 [Candidatus Wolfebacteria bacterium]